MSPTAPVASSLMCMTLAATCWHFPAASGVHRATTTCPRGYEEAVTPGRDCPRGPPERGR
jgi:hypothetical protein